MALNTAEINNDLFIIIVNNGGLAVSLRNKKSRSGNTGRLKAVGPLNV